MHGSEMRKLGRGKGAAEPDLALDLLLLACEAGRPVVKSVVWRVDVWAAVIWMVGCSCGIQGIQNDILLMMTAEHLLQL